MTCAKNMLIFLQAAETGSGKTGAFCLPVLQIVWESLRDQITGKTHKPASTVGSVFVMFLSDSSFKKLITNFIVFFRRKVAFKCLRQK